MARRITTLLFLIISYTNCWGIFFHNVDSIIVYSLNWDAIYCSTVSCSNFFSYTNCERQYTIKDKETIKLFLFNLGKLRKTYSNNIDVRSKVFFFSEDTIIDSACIGKDGILLDGTFYENSNEIENIIRKIEFHKNTINIKNMYVQPRSTIVKGYKYLNKEIKKIKKHIKFKETFIIKGFCFADINGHTKKIKLMKYSKDINSNDIVNRIETIFIKRIIWNKNKERMISDIIPITIIISK